MARIEQRRRLDQKPRQPFVTRPRPMPRELFRAIAAALAAAHAGRRAMVYCASNGQARFVERCLREEPDRGRIAVKKGTPVRCWVIDEMARLIDAH